MFNATSCQSENADAGYRDIIAYLAAATQWPLNFVNGLAWEQRRERVDQGAIDIAWMCGLWYVKRRDDYRSSLELMAAPVMLGERYENRPIYYSNLLVRSGAAANSLLDLKNSRFAINEADSHSGCVVVGYALAQANLTWQHFGSVTQSGGHLNSIQLLLNNQIDAAAIDSTTFETACRRNPQLHDQLRTIAVLGPSSIPPWTLRAELAPQAKADLTSALRTMHHSAAGVAVLAKHGYRRFAPVQDSDYDDIRLMRRAAIALPFP